MTTQEAFTPTVEGESKIAAVLTELDSRADQWAVENRMSLIAWQITKPGARHEIVAKVLAMLQLAYSEGYYHAAVSRPAETDGEARSSSSRPEHDDDAPVEIMARAIYEHEAFIGDPEEATALARAALNALREHGKEMGI